MNERKPNRSHRRIVFECKMAIKKASEEADSDKMLKVMSRYGRKTVDDAVREINEEHAKEMGMTMEEFEAWLKEDD